MAILVVQSAAGTTALNGSAPDPTNVPGNNWFASNVSFKRSASGGVLIPDGAFVTGNLSYDVGTARHKLKISSLTLSNGGSYVRLLINKSTLSAAPFDSTAGSSGYGIIIQANSGIQITTWTNGSAPTGIGATTSAILPSSLPLTVTDIFIEHFVNGTINASATVGGTTYTSTISGISSPLSGTIAGLFGASSAATNVTATELVIENEVTVTYTYARPSSDVTTQWSTSSGTDHYALIDETTANDADYIVATAAGQTDEVKLASMTAPQAGTDLLINYKVAGIVGSASVTMSLRQGSGGTLIATDTAKTSDNTYQLVVPAATWASVTDWTDLRLRFVSA
jgi:hypothetical protein